MGAAHLRLEVRGQRLAVRMIVDPHGRMVDHLDPAAPISEVGYVYVLLTRPDPEQAILEAQARDSLGIERATSALDAQLEAATEE